MERTPEPLGKGLEEVPPPEGELAKVAGGTGPRSELDPALGFVLDNFKAAVGLEGSVPTAEEVESWALALEKCEPALLQKIAFDVGVDPASIFGAAPDELKHTVLAWEVSSRPVVKTDGELTRELLQQQFSELRAVREEAAARALVQDEKISGLQQALLRTQEVAESALEAPSAKVGDSAAAAQLTQLMPVSLAAPSGLGLYHSGPRE